MKSQIKAVKKTPTQQQEKSIVTSNQSASVTDMRISTIIEPSLNHTYNTIHTPFSQQNDPITPLLKRETSPSVNSFETKQIDEAQALRNDSIEKDRQINKLQEELRVRDAANTRLLEDMIRLQEELKVREITAAKLQEELKAKEAITAKLLEEKHELINQKNLFAQENKLLLEEAKELKLDKLDLRAERERLNDDKMDLRADKDRLNEELKELKTIFKSFNISKKESLVNVDEEEKADDNNISNDLARKFVFDDITYTSEVYSEGVQNMVNDPNLTLESQLTGENT